MSIRGRLDQLQAKANWTMDDARELIRECAAFLARLEEKLNDGVGVTLDVPPRSEIKKEFQKLITGKGAQFPGTVVIDINYSKLPKPISEFVGGPYGGKRFVISPKHQKQRTMILTGNCLYSWDGYRYQYEGTAEETLTIKPAD